MSFFERKKVTEILLPYEEASELAVSVNEAKEYLRIESNYDDAIISAMIKACTQSAEKYMRVSIMNQKWKLCFNGTPDELINLPMGPVTSVVEVRYKNNGSWTVLSNSNYELVQGNEKLKLKSAPYGEEYEVIYNAGYTSTSNNTPEILRQGILCQLAYMYERNFPASKLADPAISMFNFYRRVRI